MFRIDVGRKLAIPNDNSKRGVIMATNFKKVTGFIIGINIVIGIGSTALAQQNNLTDRLKNASARINELVQANADYMSPNDQRDALELLRQVRDIVRPGNNNPSPQPPPAPYPGNPSMSLRGAIETSEFTFNVADLVDLHNQCVTFVKTTIAANNARVDDITLSINYSAIKNLRNSSSYWTGANEICLILTKEAKAAGLPLSNYGEKIYMGRIETVDFTFAARSIPDLGQKCESFVKANSLQRVDDINVSVNFGETRVLRNASTYWTGSIEICQQIINIQQ